MVLCLTFDCDGRGAPFGMYVWQHHQSVGLDKPGALERGSADRRTTNEHHDTMMIIIGEMAAMMVFGYHGINKALG